MFKAIGRWGANVKSNLSLKFLTNLFSKSKSYNEIDSDEEEIFSDAREDLLELEDDPQDDRILMREKTEMASTSVTKEILNGHASELVTAAHSSQSDDSNDENDEESDDDEGITASGASELTNHDDTSHNHKESDKILDTESKPSNGLIRNASSSAFKKVHRRINSFSQRQYSKMDENTDESEIEIDRDSNDNIDGINGAANGKVKTSKQKSKSKEKKTQKRNKAAKRTRKAIRGSWKWFKRGMLGYARAFNAPSFFIINASGMAARKKY